MNSILIDAKNLLYDLCGLELSNIEIEKESTEYAAHRFEINNIKILFRQAKITPTKVGQFVTLWKRTKEKDPIEPFEITDNVDLFVITVKTEERFGQFVFPKSVLIEKGIVSNIKEGKRAIRVYPPWDKTENKQSQKTQKWQLSYFLEIPFDKTININQARTLYFQ
jgi:hypothetical protein